VSRILRYAIGAGLAPVTTIYGIGSYLLQRRTAAPTLLLGPEAGLLLGVVSLIVFAGCVWGLHLSLAEKLRRKPTGPD